MQFDDLIHALHPDMDFETAERIDEIDEVEFHAVGIKLNGIDVEETQGKKYTVSSPASVSQQEVNKLIDFIREKAQDSAMQGIVQILHSDLFTVLVEDNRNRIRWILKDHLVDRGIFPVYGPLGYSFALECQPARLKV